MLKMEIINKKTYHTIENWDDLSTVLLELFNLPGNKHGLSLVEINFGCTDLKKGKVNNIVFVQTELSDMIPYKLLQEKAIKEYSERKDKLRKDKSE